MGLIARICLRHPLQNVFQVIRVELIIFVIEIFGPFCIHNALKGVSIQPIVIIIESFALIIHDGGLRSGIKGWADEAQTTYRAVTLHYPKGDIPMVGFR